MAVRQYHLTVFARVEDGQIIGWDICEPGSEPTSHVVAVYNEDTDEWEHSYGEGNSNTWDIVEREAFERLSKR